MQLELGASGITVSTLYEADVFADHGFDDITWAFPVPLSRIPQAVRLAQRVRLGVVVDSHAAIEALAQTGEPLHVWLKVDCGYHRAGVDPCSDDAVELARMVVDSGTLSFDGILSHSGHAYDVASTDAAAVVAESERAAMVEFAARLADQGIDVPGVSVGSTPAMRSARGLSGVTEARPGNYALYDYSQAVLGSCTPADCAVSVIASVVSSPAGGEHSIVDAGALSLSKDPGPVSPHSQTMGEIYEEYVSGTLNQETRLVSVSQEHGRVNRELPIGERVRILPNHSCLTVAHFDEMHVVRGDQVEDRWKVWRGRD
jgi:D-serine deaminase-like pyridoxal phosphate-dependent protein